MPKKVKKAFDAAPARTKPYLKVRNFNKFSDEALTKFISACGFVSDSQDFVLLRDHFKRIGKTPTLFELRLFDYAIENILPKHQNIDLIEIASGNPHIRAALEKYREYEKQAEENVTSIHNVTTSLGKKAGKGILLQGGGRAVRYGKNGASSNGTHLLSIQTALNSVSPSADAADISAMTAVAARCFPIHLFRSEFIKSTSNAIKRALRFSEYAVAAGIPSAGISTLTKKRLDGDADASFAVCMGKYSDDAVFSPSKGDIIFTVSCGGNAMPDAHAIEKFSTLFSQVLFSSSYAYCGRSTLDALLSLGMGIEIDLISMPNRDICDLIQSSFSQFVITVKPSKVKKFFEKATAFTVRRIGVVTNSQELKVMWEEKAAANIPLETLRHGNYRYHKVKITDKPYIAKNFDSNIDKTAMKSILEDSPVSNHLPYDYTVSGGTLYAPFGGKGGVPSDVFGISLDHCIKDKGGIFALYASDDSFSDSPFVCVVNALTVCLSKLAAAGVPADSVAAAIDIVCPSGQMLSGGALLSAALGALYAESNTSLCITSFDVKAAKKDGGALVTCCAGTVAPVDSLISNIFKPGHKLFRITIKRDAYHIPDFKQYFKIYHLINMEMQKGNVESATVIEGSLIRTLLTSIIGEGLGFSFAAMDADYFGGGDGDILLSIDDISAFYSVDCRYIGIVDDSGLIKGADISIGASDLKSIAAHKLQDVQKLPSAPIYHGESVKFSGIKTSKPKVFIPALQPESGRQLAAAFERAGAEPVLKIIHAEDFADPEFLKSVRKDMSSSHILSFTGTASPSGYSVKNGYYQFLMNSAVMDSVNELLLKREGLIAGFGEGMRALIDCGLLAEGRFYPDGKASKGVEIVQSVYSGYGGRIAKTRILSSLSPWYDKTAGESFVVTLALSAGSVSAKEGELVKFASQGRLTSAFIDGEGNPTMLYPFNPTGSAMAVEGLTSPDGRILGKLSQAERFVSFRNIKEKTDADLFIRGIKYFQ